MTQRHPSRGLYTVLATGWLAGAAGCYYHRVEIGSSDRSTERVGVAPTAKTDAAVAWSFLYGSFHGGGITADSLAKNCNNVPLREVTVRSNPLFFLITVASLGAVAPARVEWSCTRPAVEEGEMPARPGPGPGSSSPEPRQP